MAECKELAEFRTKVTAHRGELFAQQAIETALRQANLPVKDTYSPQELYHFADQLVVHGGFVELVARTLKLKALKAGANPK